MSVIASKNRTARHSCGQLLSAAFVLLLLVAVIVMPTTVQARFGIPDHVVKSSRPFGLLDVVNAIRGGGGAEDKKQVFRPLAQALLPYLQQQQKGNSAVTTEQITAALVSLAASQQTFKGLDGVAHEAYQRTHTKEEISLHVSGRAMRTVARTQAVALGLGACELCELAALEVSLLETEPWKNGTLADKQILCHETITVKYQKQNLNVSVLVLYQPDYHGGAGIEHANVFGERPSRIYHGRLLIALDTADTSPANMLQILGLPAQLVPLKTTQHEAASVQPMLYRAASQVLQHVEAAIRPYNSSAIHVVGHSLAGGVATLLATMLEGHLAPHKSKTGGTTSTKGTKKGRKSKVINTTKTATVDTRTETSNITATGDVDSDSSNNTTVGAGWGRGRTSCCVLGAPPSLSANVPTDTLVTNIVYGDDWVSRTTEASVQRLVSRIQPILKRNSVLKQAALLSDTFKLATQGLSAHAHGREGEECRLTSTTGSQSYLLRPRRYGNHVSIHEMGRAKGREAIRAAVLWQLSDIMITPSYAKHHTLHSYIHGLDRVHVRGLDDGRNDEPDGLEEAQDGVEEPNKRIEEGESEAENDQAEEPQAA